MVTSPGSATSETVTLIRSAKRRRRRIVRAIGDRPELYEGERFWNCNIVEFDARHYVFSHRAILTLVTISSCNAGCKFCSNEITFTPSGPYLRWGPRLERVKDFALTSGVRKVAFTGGEPTLRPQRLLDLVAAVTPGFSRARLHTNAYGLFHRVETSSGDRELLPALIDAGLTGVSVSLAHHDPMTNRDLMLFSPIWAGADDMALREIAAHAAPGFTPRLSCVMTNEGISSVEQILDYIRWGRELGFRHFIFRSCSEIPEDFRKATNTSEYNATNYIPIDPLVAELDTMPELHKTYTQRKSDSKVDCYRWRDVTFDMDESSEEPDPDRKIRRLNVMPNGVAYTCWIDPLAVLFEEDLPIALAARDQEFPLSEVREP